MESRRSERMRSSRHQQRVEGAVSRGCRKAVMLSLVLTFAPGTRVVLFASRIGVAPIGCCSHPAVVDMQAVPNTKQPIATLLQVTLLAS